MKRFILIILIFEITSLTAFSSDFIIGGIETENYPLLQAGFFIRDDFKQELTDLQKEEFTIYENGEQIPIQDYELICSNVRDYTCLLILDASKSMVNIDSTNGRIRWLNVRDAAIDFINKYPLSEKTQIGTIAFNSIALHISDFSNNQNKLTTDLLNFDIVGGATNFNAPFFDPEIGAFKKFEDAPKNIKKIIIFLSDGQHDQIGTGIRINDIINELQLQNITLYNIFYNTNINPAMASAAQNTGGFSRIIDSQYDVDESFTSIYEDIRSKDRCYLEWLSPNACNSFGSNNDVLFKFERKNSFYELNLSNLQFYIVPEQKRKYLDRDKEVIEFFANEDIDKAITLTAINSDFVINDFNLEQENNYEIDFGNGFGVPILNPISIREGNSFEIKFRLKNKVLENPTNGYLYLESKPCELTIPLIAGTNFIEVTAPEQDTLMYVCDDLQVCWDGKFANRPVNILYDKLDDGSENWNLLESNIINTKCVTLANPFADTGRYMIRATAISDNNLIWTKREGSFGNEVIYSAVESNSGTYYAFIGTYDMNTNIGGSDLINLGEKDIFLAVYDNIGQVIKVISGGTGFDEKAVGINTDSEDRIIFSLNSISRFSMNKELIIDDNLNSRKSVLGIYDPKTDKLTHTYLGKDNIYNNFNNFSDSLIVDENEDGIRIYIRGYYNGSFYDPTTNLTLPLATNNSPFTAVFNRNLDLLNIGEGHWDIEVEEEPEKSSITFLTYSNFNNSILIGKRQYVSNGGTDFIFSKNVAEFQAEDESNIISAERSSLTFLGNEFGHYLDECQVDDTCEFEINDLIQNQSNLPFRVAGFSETQDSLGYDPEDFTINDNIIGQIINPGEFLNLDIKFSPSYTGNRETILLVWGECSDTLRIKIKGDGVCFATAVDTLIIPTIRLSNNYEYVAECIWQNTSQNPMTITPYIHGEDFGYFSAAYADNPDLPLMSRTYAPGECANFIFRFTPDEAREYKAIISYDERNPCRKSETVIIARAVESMVIAEGFDWGRRRINGNYEGKVIITNLGKNEELVEDISLIQNGFDNNFIFDKSNFPINLPVDESIEVPVVFNPDLEISYQVDYEVILSQINEGPTSSLLGEGYLPKLAMEWNCEGESIIGESRQGTLSLSNPSLSSALFIKEIILENNNNFKFPADEITENIMIEKGEEIELKIDFSPNGTDPNTSNVTVFADNYDATFDNEWLENQLEIGCDVLNINPQLPDYDFQTLLICDSKTDIIQLSNEGSTSSFSIINYEFVGDESYFDLELDLPFPVEPNSISEIPITFNPGIEGNFQTELILYTDLTNPIRTNLTGNSVVPKLYAIPEYIEKYPGEEFKYTIYLDSPYFREGNLESIKLKLNYNGYVINLLDESFEYSDALTQENWTWNIEQQTTNITEFAGTGSASIPMNAPLFSFNYGTYFNEVKNTEILARLIFDCHIEEFNLSRVKILEICFDSGGDVVFTGNEFYLNNPTPNPTSDILNLNFGVGLDNLNVSIKIIDTNGEIIDILTDRNYQSGEYEIIYNTQNLSSGVYFISYQSGIYQSTVQFSVIK